MGEHSPDLFSLVPFAVSPADPSLMVAVDYHIPLISTNGGGSWSNLYCTGDPVSGWRARGLNIMAATCSDVLNDGRLVLGANDFGVFLESSTDSTKFHLLYETGWPSAIDVESVSYAGTNEVYFVDDYHLRDDGTRTDRLLAYNVDADDGVWHDIGAGIMSGHVSVTDVEFISPTRMFVAIANDEDSTKVYHVFEGTRPDTGAGFVWVWQDWFDPGANVRIINSLHHIPGTDLLLMGTKVRWGESGLYEGGVYCLDISDQAAPVQTWIAGNAVGDGKLFRNVRCFASDETGEYVYVGTSGGDTPFSVGRGGVTALVAPFTPSGFDSLAYLANGPSADDTFGLAGINNFPTNPNALDWEYATQVGGIQVDPANPRILYIALGCRGFYDKQFGAWRCDWRSGTSGWSQVSGGVDGYSSSARTVCIDPARPGELYVGTAGQEFLRTARMVSPVPVVSTTAEYAISPDGGPAAILAVEGTALDGGPLASAYVDAALLGGPQRLELNDLGPPIDGSPGDRTAGDNIWSAVIPDPITATPGTYLLPIVARDPQWNTHTGELEVVVVAASGRTFVDKSADTGALQTVNGDPYTVIPLDFNGDGIEDLLLSNLNGDGQLFSAYSIDPVSFIGVSDLEFYTDIFGNNDHLIADNYGLAAADFNNDGQEDFFVSHFTDPRLYTWVVPAGGGAGYFKNIIAEVLDPIPSHVYAAAWGDMNHDGWVDLALVGSLEEPLPPYPGIGPDNVHIYKNLAGRLKLEFLGPVPTDGTKALAGPSPFSTAWTDVNADNLLDILVCNADPGTGGARIYVNGGYVPVTKEYSFFDDTATWFGAGGGPEQVVHAEFVDLEGDGDQDLVVARADSVDNLQFYRKEATGFTKLDPASWPVGEFHSPLNGLIFEDFDQDGDPDLLTVPSRDTDKPRLLTNLGGTAGFGELGDSGLPAGTANRGMSFNWSGAEPSVFLAKSPQTIPGTVSEFFFGYEKSPGSTQAGFITVVMDHNAPGPVNRAGIGVKVMVFYNGRSQYRWIDGGSGHGTQQSHTLVCGLGEIADPSEEAIVVAVWPDGTYTVFGGLPFTTVMLTQPGDLTASSVTGYYQPGAGDNWLVFEWDAPYPTTAEAVLVPAGKAGNPPECDCVSPSVPTTIGPGLTSVVLEVSQVAEHQYHHVMKWQGRCCYQNCNYDYTLSIRLNNVVDTRTGTLGTGPICLQNPPAGN